MLDVEIESLLEEAGYQFDPSTGRYAALDGGEGEVDYATEDMANQLEIPIDDLIRWEQEQTGAEPTGA